MSNSIIQSILRKQTKLKKQTKKLIALCAALSLIFGAGAASYTQNRKADANSPVNIWWPTESAHVTGVQPFKGLLANTDINSYSMYWQVDGGQLNLMNNDNTDYPHKQADVDASSWNWHGSGPYTIEFVAKDLSGNIIGQQAANIYIGAPQINSAPVQSAPTIVQSANVNSTPATTTPAAPTNNPTSSSSSSSMDIWWPFDGANLIGTQPLKAVVPNTSTDTYSMYWQVDGGTLNPMQTNNNGGTHKEADVNVTGWNWHGSGPYKLGFVAKDGSGNTIANKTITIYVGSTVTAAPLTATTNSITPISNTLNSTFSASVSASTSVAPTSSNNSGDPFSGQKLWVDPNSDAANWVKQAGTSSSDGQLMEKVAGGAETQWFSTDWISNMQSAVSSYVHTAQAAGDMPTMVLYNIPMRDCGQFSSGGANDPSFYEQTVNQFAAGIGNAKAAVIIEPDALTLTSCLSSSQLSQRFDMLKYAVQKFASLGNTATYLDIGHPGWVAPDQAAHLLASAGVQGANGFALNVSNFNTDSENITYGTQIDNALSKLGINGKHMVIDTGRNGNGSNGQWCNPSGRALGDMPTTNTGNSMVDAFLWVKGPGGSDGNCNGGPAAGQFWPQYALDLARNSH